MIDVVVGDPRNVEVSYQNLNVFIARLNREEITCNRLLKASKVRLERYTESVESNGEIKV